MQASSSPLPRLIRFAIYVALVCIAVPGLAAIYSLIAYNPARGDEFFSFVENYDCGFAQLMVDIKQGMDVSYLHAAALWLGFKLFGHTIYIQRGLSFLFYVGALSHLYFLFRTLYKSKLLRCILVVSIAFCNLGLFIASDGRFYAMLFYISVAFIHYFLYMWSKGQKSSIWVLSVIQLAGLLVSAQFMMLQALVLAGLLITWIIRKDKAIVKKQLMPLLLSTAISAGMYIAFFRIEFFTSFQMAAMLQNHHERRISVVSDSIDNFYRWLLLPDSFLVVSLILAVLLYFVIKKKLVFKSSSALETFCTIAGLIPPFILFIKTLLCIKIGAYYLWPARYYTSVFFLIAFVTSHFYRGFMIPGIRFVLLLGYLGLCVCEMYLYFSRYSDYALEKASYHALVDIVQKINEPIAIYQLSENSTEEIQFYSALYCYHPELADRLQLYYNDGDKFRKQFMQTLQKKRPHAHVYLSPQPLTSDSFSLNKNVYYIVNERDSRFQKFEQDRIAGSNNMKLIYNP